MRTFLILITLLSMISISGSALASHTVITNNNKYYDSRHPNGWNGYRVFLSSPTHQDSGNRGELGWEENINGRHWNTYAARFDYINGNYYSYHPSGSLSARGYQVIVGQNGRNGLYTAATNAGNAWNADVYIVSHTNALAGSSTGNYMLILKDNLSATSKDESLATRFRDYVGPYFPGTERIANDGPWEQNGGGFGNFYEISSANNADYNIYVELFFHDNQSHVDFFGSGNDWDKAVTYHAWRVGYAVDLTLGHPRP